ncbi:SDR family NAD(P)-dependent oxidoreductase [Pseudomonas sp. LT1P18]|uniref:SDR family NAD(P)-dependent oxidoreductase n=1 Tax=Pseudomonas arabinosi TaxID=3398357 RepID=UPI0039EF736A
MNGRLRGKRALITGASSGIGRAIAEAFIAEGADVFITALTDEVAAREVIELAEHLGQHASFTLMDAASIRIETLFEEAHATIGPIDILVNNPAFITRTPFLELGGDEYEQTLAVNLRFPFFATQRFAKGCIARRQGGSVINISSVSAFKAVSRMSAYQASKAALSMLTRSCAVELAPHGIRVNTISPGLTATSGNANQWRDAPEIWQNRKKEIPMQRAGIPSDMAGAAILLASDESSWMTGADLVIDGGHSCV